MLRNLLRLPRARRPRIHRLAALAVLVAASTAGLAIASSAAPLQTDGVLDLKPLRGQVVVVDFWASWCVPCRRSLPWLNAMHAKYGDQGLKIIGVNVDRERGDAQRFLLETPVDFQILFDPQGRLPAQYGVVAMPSSLVFDRSGQLVATHLGFRNARRAEYEETLRKLLQENPE